MRQTSDEFDAPRLGLEWQWQANEQRGWGLALLQARSIDAIKGSPEERAPAISVAHGPVWLRVRSPTARCAGFSWSTDGASFTDVDAPFRARQGRWVGAKVGLFAMRPAGAPAGAYADFDFFRISSR